MKHKEGHWFIARNSSAYLINWPKEDNAVLWFSSTGDTFVVNSLGREIFMQLSQQSSLSLTELSQLLSLESKDVSASEFSKIILRYLNQFKLLGMLEEVFE